MINQNKLNFSSGLKMLYFLDSKDLEILDNRYQLIKMDRSLLGISNLTAKTLNNYENILRKTHSYKILKQLVRFFLFFIFLKKLSSISKKIIQWDIAIIHISDQLTMIEMDLLRIISKCTRIPIFSSADNFTYLTNTIEPLAHIALRERNKKNHRIRHISEIYGCKKVIAEYCNMPISQINIPGFWMHGWIPAYHNVHFSFIALHKRESKKFRFLKLADPFNKNDLQLVTRQDQKTFLLQQDYKNVLAIGHPIVYLKKEDCPKKIENSLLIVPPHGGGFRGKNDKETQDYVEYIHSIQSNFSIVRLCVTVEDYIRKDWWPLFQKIGIHTIVSVDRSNPYAMARLKQILSPFEYVTTNCLGSAIVYGAYFGCKVSVSGPYLALPKRLLQGAHAIIHYPELLDTQIELCSEAALKNHYPELFVNPKDALLRTSWAAQELGYKNKLSPKQFHMLMQGNL